MRIGAQRIPTLCFVVVPHAVALSVLLAACAVLCCRLPVLPSHFPPLSLCFPSALLRVILLKTCLLPDGFVFADTMPEAHEWRTARIFFFFFFSMNTDPKIQQGGHAGSSEMSVSPSGAHSGRGRQPVTFFPCSVKS